MEITIEGFNGSTVVPSSLYPCNLLTPKWEKLYSHFFSLYNPLRINRWTAKYPEIKEAFSYWIKHQPSMFSYEHQVEMLGSTTYPRWEFDDDHSNIGSN